MQAKLFELVLDYLEEEQKFYALKNAIQEGIESGIAVNFDPDEHLKKPKEKK